jgi:hypothetical protein
MIPMAFQAFRRSALPRGFRPGPGSPANARRDMRSHSIPVKGEMNPLRLPSELGRSDRDQASAHRPEKHRRVDIPGPHWVTGGIWNP